MRVVNMHDAKTQLSRLVQAVVEGEPFIIARAGVPLVKVLPLDAPDVPAASDRIGFLTDVLVPDDFDRMGADVIIAGFRRSP